MLDLKKISLNKNSMLVGVAVLAILITVVLVFIIMGGNTMFSFLKLNPFVLQDTVANKAIDYINANVLQGQTATLGTVTEESGVIKIQVKIDTNSYDSFVTKDGKLFFPQALKLDEPPPVQ